MAYKERRGWSIRVVTASTSGKNPVLASKVLTRLCALPRLRARTMAQDLGQNHKWFLACPPRSKVRCPKSSSKLSCCRNYLFFSFFWRVGCKVNVHGSLDREMRIFLLKQFSILCLDVHINRLESTI